MDSICIFISSPGDVAEEREYAKQVIAALQWEIEPQIIREFLLEPNAVAPRAEKDGTGIAQGRNTASQGACTKRQTRRQRRYFALHLGEPLEVLLE